MAEYINKNESVDESYLQNWYIDSVDESGTPHWTEEHIEELVKDFIVIPIETPSADVEPVVHAKWEQVDETKDRCSNCETIYCIYSYPYTINNYCPNCGARMDAKMGGEENGRY